MSSKIINFKFLFLYNVMNNYCFSRKMHILEAQQFDLLIDIYFKLRLHIS